MSRFYTFRTVPPELRDASQWRNVDVNQLDDQTRRRFERLRVGLTHYLETGHVSEAARLASVSRNTICRQFNRCVATAADGQPFGWAGILPHMRTQAYRRRAPVNGDVRGFSGAFQNLLDAFPGIRTALDDLILGSRAKGSAVEANAASKTVWRRFQALCKEAGMCASDYPFNTADQGRRSIARYVAFVLNDNASEAAANRFGRNAAYRLRFGTERSSVSFATTPYVVGQCDAHLTNCIGSMVLDGPIGPQAVAIQRLWFIAYLDAASRCILGYSIGFGTQVSALKIQEAFIEANRPWTPMTSLVPGVTYDEGAGFPSGLIPELRGCSHCIINLDNAVQHYARAIKTHLRRRHGCHLSYSALADWGHNDLVERWFKTLEGYGFHRIPSTTGGSSIDARRKSPVEQAIRQHITYKQLIYLADVICANYNAHPHRALGGRSPLDLLREFAVGASIPPPKLPPPNIANPELGVEVVTCTVRGCLKDGRRPYVQYLDARYTSAALCGEWSLIGNKIQLHIQTDARYAEAYLPNGCSIGQVKITEDSKWGKHSHPLETRRKIRQNYDLNEAVRHAPDAIGTAAQTLANQAYEQARKKRNRVSRHATQLAKLMHETQVAQPTAEAPQKMAKKLEEPDLHPLTHTLRPVTWKA
ncbi:hypothetical protein [Pandoraea commovens]|uniref:Integrase catalytic subunit n=1 Tax=Pandoraea commovens TaxID=2508289 RepID=A0ABY5QM66_9BURK|nr:hypothetical protein [Pandoraea commovens]UVA81901.1 hypothetical protein NTU39_13295 [Pandoraea commovens]